MKKVLIIAALVASHCSLSAQKLTYQQKAEEIKKQVWGISSPEFALKDAPDSLKSESAVILARSFDVQRTKGSRFKWAASGGTGSVARSEKTTVFHERVKINDKSSLEEFSTIEYTKKVDNTEHYGVSKLRKTAETFVGIKVLKPGGKEIVMDISEEVLLKDRKDETGKIAVSDLEIGDIIDYYITTSEIFEGYSDNVSDNSYVFFLKDEYPVLSYKVDFKYSSNLVVKYMSGNGAPELNETTNKDKDRIISVHLKNLPKHKGLIWTSAYRQFPYIIISGTFTARGVDKDYADMPVLDAYVKSIESLYDVRTGVVSSELEDKTKNYFGGSKQLKAAPVDSVVKAMYNIWKHSLFCYYDGQDMDMSNDRNSRDAVSIYHAALFSQNLLSLKINHDVLLVASRYAAPLDAKKRNSLLEAFIRINGPQPIYLFFNNVVTLYNEIPSIYQGEKVVSLTPDRVNKFKTTFTRGESVLPVIGSSQNNITEVLNVSLQNDDLKKLKIVRTCKESGSLKNDDQLHLLLMENIDNELTTMVKGKPLETRLSKNYITKKMVDDYQAAFVKAKSEEKKNFTSEIKDKYDQEPQQISDYKILNSGLNSVKPEFEYTSTFSLDNLVKKAGNNYIVEAGKLTGGFLKLENDARKRVLDVYMSSARSFNYMINFTIPKGYKVKGIDELNFDKKNKTGAFISKAVLNGDILKIEVSRSYTNNFEKASDWPLLTEIIDAANEFELRKLLLEKAN